jgi:hypothetical protein
VQRAQLFDHEESEDDTGSAGTEEILPPLPQAHAAQGSEIIDEFSNWRIEEC